MVLKNIIFIYIFPVLYIWGVKTQDKNTPQKPW